MVPDTIKAKGLHHRFTQDSAITASSATKQLDLIEKDNDMKVNSKPQHPQENHTFHP
jgi:hypothetical protein